MPTFLIRAETASESSVADFASTFSGIRAGGGTGVSVFRNVERDRPRAEFSLHASDRGQAFMSVARMLLSLTEAAPMLAGGWVLVSLRAT